MAEKKWPTYAYMCVIKIDDLLEDSQFDSYNEIDTKNVEEIKDWIKSLDIALLKRAYFEWYSIEYFCIGINTEILLDENIHVVPFTGFELRMLKIEAQC